MLEPMAFDHIEGVIPPMQNPGFFGHEAVISFLQQMLREDRLHHALLFEGPQGTGKATLAFHMAWSMLTRGGGQMSAPDTSSAVWGHIGKGAQPGLLHIARAYDAKTQKFRQAITVDDIRRITRFLQQTASDNSWRIVIIDPADDMNRNAANALLKTLEEPPSRTLFILISHNAGRLLATIRSRCQSIIFKPLADAHLRQALTSVAGPVGFKADDPQTEELISRSQGSVRQAVLILASGGLDIARAVDTILAAPILPVSDVHRLASAVSGRDANVQFDFFLDYVTRLLAHKASGKAGQGQLGQAAELSQFWHMTQQEISDTIAYNLDKKQFVIVLLHKMHETLQSLAGGG